VPRPPRRPRLRRRARRAARTSSTPGGGSRTAIGPVATSTLSASSRPSTAASAALTRTAVIDGLCTTIRRFGTSYSAGTAARGPRLISSSAPGATIWGIPARPAALGRSRTKAYSAPLVSSVPTRTAVGCRRASPWVVLPCSSWALDGVWPEASFLCAGPLGRPGTRRPVDPERRPRDRMARSESVSRSVETRRVAWLAAFPSTPRLRTIGSADNRSPADIPEPAALVPGCGAAGTSFGPDDTPGGTRPAAHARRQVLTADADRPMLDNRLCGRVAPWCRPAPLEVRCSQ